MPSDQTKLKVEAVIFDLDGTLIDSIDIYFAIVENTLKRLDLPPVSRDRIVAAAESENFKWEQVLPQEVINREADIIDKAWAVINEIAPQMFADNLCLIPGADRVLQMLSARGLKVGLVTSTQRHYLETKMQPLKSRGLHKLIEVIITSDDVAKRKPAADPLIMCARLLDIPPTNCVYIGDTATDMQAGRAAAMHTVGVLTGFDDYAILERQDPDAIIASVQDLMEVLG